MNIKKKFLFTIAIILCMFISGCNSSNMEREKYSDNTKPIYKNNIYGCWKSTSNSLTYKDVTIYNATDELFLKFSNDNFELLKDNESIKYNYTINNNILEIDNKNNSYLLDKYLLVLNEGDTPKLAMSSSVDNYRYDYIFEYEGIDCN